MLVQGLKEYRDRVAIITGASSGLGEGFARMLAGRGARVVLVARRKALLDRIAGEIVAAGGSALALPCDVELRAEVDAAAAQVLERYGRIDLLINNAGYNNHTLFKDHDVADIEKMMRVNYLSVVYWTKAVLPAMRKQGAGWMVNLSSVAGKLGQPDEAAYAATKFAIAGLSESLAYEFDPLGIHVMCVHPAVVKTEMFTPEVMARMPAQAKRSFIDVETFCTAVLAALERGQYEVTVPRYVAIAYLIRLIAPGFFRKQTARMRLGVIPNLTT
ncbi:MAG TPA: SDR family NAD(P)-dependent oxidoreductase [Candidatus Bathyarchaeia archaeon]|nr:SDR family NAD(P)-dependent oxidoreductase [Candidatus Bathyarchaeia archaeon]